MKLELPPKDRQIGEPEDGWKENALYSVMVSFQPGNPIHPAILFTGYLNGGYSDGKTNQPGGYHALFNPSWDSNATLSDIHFLRVVRQLSEEDQIFSEE